MTNACSACGAPLPAGASKCSSCGATIMAFAVPVPRKPIRRLPIFTFLFISFAVALWAIAPLLRKQEQSTAAAVQSTEQTERAAQLALVDSVSTIKSFEDRCGAPAERRHGISREDAIDTDPTLAHTATTLIYSQPPTEMHVVFTENENTVPILFREHLHEKVYSFSPYEGLVEMGCVKRTEMKSSTR